MLMRFPKPWAKKRLIALALVVICSYPIAWFMYALHLKVQRGRHSMAMMELTGALGFFVEDHGVWPGSWQQLMPGGEAARVRRLAGIVSVEWNFELDELRSLMTAPDRRNPLHVEFDDIDDDPPLWTVHFVERSPDMLASEVFWNRTLLQRIAFSLKEKEPEQFE